MEKRTRPIRKIILVLAVISCVLLVPASLKAKANFDKQLPPLGVLPETITVRDTGYFREGCAVPSYVDNCDGPANCYTPAFVSQDPAQPPVKLDSITYALYRGVPVYSGPPDMGRPSVYLPYTPGCLVRYESSSRG